MGSLSLKSEHAKHRASHLYLARHGETEWNRVGRWQGHTDIPLSDVGRQQAHILSQRIARLGIGVVFASDLSRAVETAALVARARNLPMPAVDARLRERGFGCFEGLTRDECAERFPEAWALYQKDRQVMPPGAEASGAVIHRMMSALSDIAERLDAHGDGDFQREGHAALVVSHGGALRLFAHAVTGHMPAPLANGALLRVVYESGVFSSIDLLEDRPEESTNDDARPPLPSS